MSVVARLERVWKRFGSVAALRCVSFELGKGEVAALLGPNGAGKTTAISLLLGLRLPDHGRALLFGVDPRTKEARRRIGVTPQEVAFPPTVTVRELVELVRCHYPRPAPLEEILEEFGLVELRARKTGGLSGGERRRLALALAFAGRPELVVLDEPTAGLDVAARRAFWRAIRGFNEGGGSVLLTTHHLEEAEALAQRVTVLSRGRVVAAGSVEEVSGSLGLTRVRLRAASLPELPGVARAGCDRGVWTLHCRDADTVVRELVRRRLPFQSLEIRPVSLEEAFLALTGEQ